MSDGKKRCAYLVMKEPGDFVTDYDLSFDAMAALGWQVDCVVWDDPSIDWDIYDAVYICTPWDYPEKSGLFMQVLETIDASRAHLINPMPLVRWTLAKTYLRDFERQGGAIVPSLWFEVIDAAMVPGWFDALNADKLVIKPTVGANSKDTYVLERPVDAGLREELLRVFEGRAFFVQPFLQNILTEGEYSLFFFGGEYSHAILKTPKPGDFRSQEEHGADILSVTATPEQIAAAENILAHVEPQPAYVRADFVRDADDNFLLMELELIEPSLYFRTDPESLPRFARAIDAAYLALKDAQNPV